ncbi:FAD-dependent monooxygenase [Catenovulum maritimum]|uniref:FAD-binding domain-containing protein n=1 Tax=Catenovulum maritimum TaxID=1513271 RepID=A0A0J8GMG6_9ALTE|nr:FAD-dependent monooxygenase [Catenovulum maritimum]KMT63980.1 hypothetical protein XM47_16885 [Catenovulum maritimum]
MNKNKKILIVGAGIAGISLYRKLRAFGFSPDIIEQADSWRQDGAAICLPANAVLELDKLGLKDELLNSAHQVFDIEYALADGRELASASLKQSPCDKAPFVALMRGKLMEILRAGIDLAEVKFSTQIDSISQSSEQVLVNFNHGGTAQYDLVIAADGINSKTRGLVFPNSELNYSGVTNWRFTAQISTKNLHPVYYVGSDSAFMIYPIADDKVYCYAQIFDKDKSYFNQAAHEAIQTLFKHYCQPVQQAIAQLNRQDIVVGELKSVSQVKAVQQKVLLIGDALHGCPPSLQQGVGLALEDVNCISELLAQMPIEQALVQFESNRLTRIKWVVDESNKIIKLAGIGRFAIGRFLRNLKIKKGGPANVIGWKKLLSEKAY